MIALCTLMTAIGAGLGVVGNYMTQQATAATAQAQMDAQRKSAITNMNYAFQNYEAERQDAFDGAVSDIIKTRKNALGLNSGVEGAVNEGMEGRTGLMIKRSVLADTADAVASKQDNYARKSNEIDLNKETTSRNTKSQLESINASAPTMPSAFGNFLDTAGIVIGSYTTGRNIRQQTIKDTGSFTMGDFWSK